MIPQTLNDSTYHTHYIKLQQDALSPKGLKADLTDKIKGTEIKNANGEIAAIVYDTNGVFHYLNSGGRFSHLAFQIVSEGSLDYRLYVSIDGVHWDDKCKAILYEYVDDNFNLGHITGGSKEKPKTDVFYYHVIGRLHFKLDVYNVIGSYFINALD